MRNKILNQETAPLNWLLATFIVRDFAMKLKNSPKFEHDGPKREIVYEALLTSLNEKGWGAFNEPSGVDEALDKVLGQYYKM